jgi:hypothetical protein
MSNSKRRRLLLVPLVVLIASVCTTGAVASAPTLATGTVRNTSATFNSVRAVGNNLIIDLSATAAYTGTFTGTATIHGFLIIHPDGSANFHDIKVFTGTVNGVHGSVTFELNGSNDSTLAYHSTATIIGATGGLTGLHGALHESGTVVIPNGPVGTYTGLIG